MAGAAVKCGPRRFYRNCRAPACAASARYRVALALGRHESDGTTRLRSRAAGAAVVCEFSCRDATPKRWRRSRASRRARRSTKSVFLWGARRGRQIAPSARNRAAAASGWQHGRLCRRSGRAGRDGSRNARGARARRRRRDRDWPASKRKRACSRFSTRCGGGASVHRRARMSRRRRLRCAKTCGRGSAGVLSTRSCRSPTTTSRPRWRLRAPARVCDSRRGDPLLARPCPARHACAARRADGARPAFARVAASDHRADAPRVAAAGDSVCP